MVYFVTRGQNGVSLTARVKMQDKPAAEAEVEGIIIIIVTNVNYKLTDYWVSQK